MCLILAIANTHTKEDIECKDKLKKLAREHDCSVSSLLTLLINQAYELEYPSKGKDYKEFMKEWKGKNGWKTKKE